MPVLVQLNIAKLRAPLDSPSLADFVAALDQVNAQAESSPGFIWRLKHDMGNPTALSQQAPWGPEYLVNLSAWDSIEALKNFTDRQSEHVAVLRRRAEWFEKLPTPDLVLWWLRDGEQPSLRDAKRRLDALTHDGETPYAFSFAKPYDASDSIASNEQVEFVLRLGDDALIHAQRISEWCGHGPVLEEDIALANIGLDYLGQARLLLTHAGKIDGSARTEDDFAYFREPEAFRNSTLVERSNSSSFGERDYAVVITKLFLHSAWMLDRWEALKRSSDPQLRAIAAKAVKECQYHFEHSSGWMIRFGDGTEESHQRAQHALDMLWPYTHEWFTEDHVDLRAQQSNPDGSRLAGSGQPAVALRAAWLARIDQVLQEASLIRPQDTAYASQGKQGTHSEQFSYLITQMQGLARAHPGATW